MSGEARFESTIPLDSLRVLLDLGREFGFDPLSSVEMEAYFACLLDHSPDTGEGLLEWIRPQVAQAFRCLVAAPRWIQNPNWQLHAGRPMQFIGQLDVTRAVGLFHDDASFYVFFDPPTGICRTIVQVS
jgi:hypothetical protein